MKKIEVSEQFLKEVHASACIERKQRIEKQFPSLFEVKLELNKWYKVPNTRAIVFITGGEITFGIAYDGTWVDDWHISINSTTYVLATSEEIESMLWKEAEKRGIRKDTKIKECLYNSVSMNTNVFICGYSESEDDLWNKNGCIYKQGKWTTPLDPNKEIKETISRLEKELKELKEKVK